MVHAPDEYGESGRAESLVVRLKMSCMQRRLLHSEHPCLLA